MSLSEQVLNEASQEVSTVSWGTLNVIRDLRSKAEESLMKPEGFLGNAPKAFLSESLA